MARDNVTLLKQTNSGGREGSDILTKQAAQSLLLAYEKKGGDQKEFKEVMDHLAESLLDYPINTHNPKELHIAKQINPEEYKLGIRRALEPLTELKEYELDTVVKYINEHKPGDLDTLKKDRALYRSAISRLLKLKTNKELSTPQLKLINAYEKIDSAFLLTIKSKNDIILGYPALKRLLEAEKEVYKAFDELKLYFKLKEIRKAYDETT